MTDSKQIDRLRKALKKYGLRPHFCCDEDNWYSCPKAPGGCSDELVEEGECNCGADRHNAEVFAILAKEADDG